MDIKEIAYLAYPAQAKIFAWWEKVGRATSIDLFYLLRPGRIQVSEKGTKILDRLWEDRLEEVKSIRESTPPQY